MLRNKDDQSAGDPIFQEAGRAAHRRSRVAGMLNRSLPAYIMVDLGRLETKTRSKESASKQPYARMIF
jgi:hypothetical protein